MILVEKKKSQPLRLVDLNYELEKNSRIFFYGIILSFIDTLSDTSYYEKFDIENRKIKSFGN